MSTYLRRPITNPENFLKSSSELNFVLRSMTRSQVFLWAGPACITASINLQTEVFIRPKEVMTSSYKINNIRVIKKTNNNFMIRKVAAEFYGDSDWSFYK